MRSCISSALNRADRPVDSSMSQKRTLSSLRSGPGSASGLVSPVLALDRRSISAAPAPLDLGFCRLGVAQLGDGRKYDLPMTERDAEFLQVGAVQVRRARRSTSFSAKTLEYLPRPRPFSQSSIDGMRGSASATSLRLKILDSLPRLLGACSNGEGYQIPVRLSGFSFARVCRRYDLSCRRSANPSRQSPSPTFAAGIRSVRLTSKPVKLIGL